jgi:hypothetical protein
MAYRPVLAPLSRDSRKDLRAELPRGSYVVKGVCQETVECGPALRPRQHPRAEGQFNLSGTAFGASAATVTFNATTVDFVGFISFPIGLCSIRARAGAERPQAIALAAEPMTPRISSTNCAR